MKTLLSWRAAADDFDALGTGLRATPNGPTFGVHRRFWSYDRHVLLSTAPPEGRGHESDQVALERERMRLLVRALRRQFPDHPVEVRYLGVRDVIDFAEIRGKVEALLEDLAEDEIEVFVSPGTGTMQTAWYFAHFGLGLNTRLFKVREGKHTRRGEPERVYEEVERSPVPQSLTIRERGSSQESPSDGFRLTRSIDPVYELARRVAATDRVTTLVLGASGVGKEHLARYVHRESARSSGPFIAINCAAWQNDQLFESRLFGHKKGAFTGADADQAGAFEEADGGTLFLDEVGDCSPGLQQSLLRVLQEREVVRLGETSPRPVDVRVIAATHRDLLARCEEGTFRWDLYFRLAVAELELPSLSERGASEVEALLDHFIGQFRRTFRRPAPLQLSRGARSTILAYPFPGNVRELQHLVERLYVFCGKVADVKDLPGRIQEPAASASFRLDDIERQHILSVYKRMGKNKTRTAEALGCSVNTLKSRLRAYEAG